MEVEGVGTGKDFKLFPGGGRAWDWNETSTRHVPGIQAADVIELLDHGSNVIVLTRGMELVLQTCPATLDMLRERGIPVHVEETEQPSLCTTNWQNNTRSGACSTQRVDCVSVVCSRLRRPS
jgi:hypothetical protein